MAAGYSRTPQVAKLGIKPGHRLLVDHQPDGWRLTDLPEAVLVVDAPEAADVILCFFGAAEEMPPLDEDWLALRFVWRSHARETCHDV